MDRVLRDKKALVIFVLPAFLFFAGIVIIPLAVSSYYSLLKWDGMGQATFIGLKNFERLFLTNVDGFPNSIIHSAIFAFLSVFVQLPLALFFALILSKGIKGEGFFRTVYFIPVTISMVAIGQLWLKIYNPDYGMLNAALKGIGLESLANPWLGNQRTALLAVFVPGVWQYIGYHMLIMYAAAKSIPDDIRMAAKIDGASDSVIDLKITIPLIMPTIKVCIIFALVGSLKIFDLVYVMTAGGPAHATEVPSTLMFSTIFSKYQYGYGSSMAVFIVIECLVITVLVKRFLKTDDISF